MGDAILRGLPVMQRLAPEAFQEFIGALEDPDDTENVLKSLARYGSWLMSYAGHFARISPGDDDTPQSFANTLAQRGVIGDEQLKWLTTLFGNVDMWADEEFASDDDMNDILLQISSTEASDSLAEWFEERYGR